MTITTRRTTVEFIDLNDRRFRSLPDVQKQWLAQELGDAPRYEDLTSLLISGNLTQDQRAILVGLQTTLVGDARARSGRAFNAGGSFSLAEIQARTLPVAQMPSGKTDLEQKIEQELPKAMLGHEEEVPSFVEAARRYSSPARQTPVFMAVVGREGHGKSEAINAFKELVLGKKAEVLTIDLREFTSTFGAAGSGTAALFGKDGPLSVENLKKRDPAYKPPKPDPEDPPQERPKPALIVLKGVEDLLANNRDFAEGFA